VAANFAKEHESKAQVVSRVWLHSGRLPVKRAEASKSDDPGNKLQKKAKQQEHESAKEKPRHPGPALAFGHQRDAQRDKPQE
jgi:hypothetical protein